MVVWGWIRVSFFRCWQKPQCNQVVLCFSCFPNKKTEQEVFVFGKKFFHFFISFIFFFSLTALIFRQEARWTSNQTFFQVLQQVYLSTCVSRETKTFHLFLLPKFQLGFFHLLFYINFVYLFTLFRTTKFHLDKLTTSEQKSFNFFVERHSSL